MKCPHCEWPIDYSELHACFTAHACDTCFTYACPACTLAIRVEVTAIPHFHLFDPQTPSDTY